MGSPLSGLLADMVVDKYISDLNTSTYKPFFIAKYVDDLFLVIHPSTIEPVLTFLNGKHREIQFTVETESSRSLNFLDMTVSRGHDNILRTTWYHKPLSKFPRLTNFNSFSNPNIKSNSIHNTLNRAILLSNKSNRDQAIHMATQVLIANNFPRELINQRLDKILRSIENRHGNAIPNTNVEPAIYISFPYTNPTTNHRIKKVLSQYIPNSKLVNSHVCKNTIFSNLKTPYPPFKRVDMVYKIDCSKCDKCYIGQTKQTLELRVGQHKSSIHNTKNPTGLTNHTRDNDHPFDFASATPLHFERDKSHRLVAESVYIMAHKNNCNLNTDLILANAYSNLVCSSFS